MTSISKHKQFLASFSKRPPLTVVTAVKNLLHLKENGITNYIKPKDHEKRKTRAYKEDIGKYYNMKKEKEYP